MARKKIVVVPNPPAWSDNRVMIAQLKGTSEFRDWLNELAAYDRSTAVQVLEKAAVLYAKQTGFSKPAPNRTGGR